MIRVFEHNSTYLSDEFIFGGYFTRLMVFLADIVQFLLIRAMRKFLTCVHIFVAHAAGGGEPTDG